MSFDYKKIMSEKTDKELSVISTIKRHEYDENALLEADNIIKKRNININDYVSEDEIELYKKSLVIDDATIPLTVLEKILAFLSGWIIYFIVRYILSSSTGIPLYILNIAALIFTVVIQICIFKGLKNKRFIKRAADFKNWVLNAYIVMASLFLLDRIMRLFF